MKTMDRLEILVEEQSMEALLKVLLPKILPQGWTIGINVFVRPHQGKTDLQNSIPNKFRAFSHGNQKTGFLILQDQDAADCRELKSNLVELCEQNNKNNSCPFKVRIVCHELEAWYLGDPKAIEKVFPHKFKSEQYKHKRICKSPDTIITPKAQLKKIVGTYPQISTATQIAKQMDFASNQSDSFKQFLDAIETLITT